MSPSSVARRTRRARRPGREAVEAGGEEQAMDLVELPLAGAVLEEDRDAVGELEAHGLI